MTDYAVLKQKVEELEEERPPSPEAAGPMIPEDEEKPKKEKKPSLRIATPMPWSKGSSLVMPVSPAAWITWGRTDRSA